MSIGAPGKVSTSEGVVAEGTRKMESIHDHNPDAKDITTIVFHALEYKRSPEAFLVQIGL